MPKYRLILSDIYELEIEAPNEEEAKDSARAMTSKQLQDHAINQSCEITVEEA